MSPSIKAETPDGPLRLKIDDLGDFSQSIETDDGATSAGPEPLFRLLQAAAVARSKGDADDISSDWSGTKGVESKANGVAHHGEEEHVTDDDEGEEEEDEGEESGAEGEDREEPPGTSQLFRMALSHLAGVGEGMDEDGNADSMREHVKVPDDGEPPSPVVTHHEAKEEEEEPVADLSDEAKVKLIEKDFGTLASDDNPELLRCEVDAGMFTEGALILGALRLTTYRLVFHAALPPAETATSSIAKVIHSGPVKVGRRRNLLRARTAWVELTPDMLTIYPDSTEEGRARPLRSYQLSAIERVYYPKTREPNVFSITLHVPHANFTAYWETGTEEAAREWVRQLRGALLQFRHRRKLHVDPGQSSTLKVCIPLSRIRSLHSQRWENLANILNIGLIEDDDTNAQGAIPEPLSISLAAIAADSRRKPDSDDMKRIVQFGIFGEEDVFGDAAREAWAARCRQPFGVEDIIVRGGGFDGEDDDKPDLQDRKEDTHTLQELRVRFGILDGEVWYHRCIYRYSHKLTSYGIVVLTPLFICFWSRSVFMTDTQLRYPLHDVEEVGVCSGHSMGWYGVKILVAGHDELHFEFRKLAWRDTALDRINQAAEAARRRKREENIAREETPQRPVSPLVDLEPVLAKSGRIVPLGALPHVPKAINMSENVRYRIKPRHFVMLSIGSRGDVQPYIALARGLLKEGHDVTIVTHEEYKEWLEGWGVKHRTAGGDAAALMKLSVEHTMFSPQFFKETLGKFRQWLDDLLVDSWNACKDADVLIESPSAMAGIHIAEALDIPYFRAFTMPWTRTRAYPHAFLSPPVEVSGAINYSTYLIFDNIFWKATSPQINRWRKKYLGLEKTDVRALAQTKVPFLYNFSPSIVPKPLDWSDSTIICGYWFLDEADPKWEPTDALNGFLRRAKRDKKPIVYIGFGSIVVPDPIGMTKAIVEAVKHSDVRAILSEGWAARMNTKANKDEEVKMPPNIYKVDKIPHDWLFPRIDAAVHHGGAGTTGASLRCGIPTLIKPWFGDQFFWATRVQKLGAGMRLTSLDSDTLADALIKATTDRVMREKAAQIGEKIRAEHGVDTAIDAIYTYLPRAASDRTTLSKTSKVLDPNSDV